jgi:hypothetical protein
LSANIKAGSPLALTVSTWQRGSSTSMTAAASLCRQPALGIKNEIRRTARVRSWDFLRLS